MDANDIFVIETSSNMLDTFQRLKKSYQEKHIRLMSVEELFVIDIKPREHLFVLDNFSGPEFRHLKELNARVFGPFGILQFFNQDQLPKLHHNRVANFAMENVIVMFSTAMDPIDQDELKELVLLMGGRITQVLADATHLVVDKVSDPGVTDAQNVNCMTKEWIRAVWKASGQRILKATDDYFQLYACPPLYGLYLSINSSSNDCNELESLILKNGGKLADYTEVQYSHLIVCDDEEVIQIPDQLDIIVVSKKWIYECDKTQTYLDPNQFRHQLVQVIRSFPEEDRRTGASSLETKDRTEEPEDPSNLAHITQEQLPSFFDRDELMRWIYNEPQKPIGICVNPDEPLAEGFASFLKTDPVVKGLDTPYPFADEKMEKDVLQFVQQAKIESQLEVGVKNATFGLRQNPLLMVLANDTTHDFKDLIKDSEEKKVPYIFVKSKYELGKAIGLKKAIICCSVLEKENSNLSQVFHQLLLDIQALNSP